MQLYGGGLLLLKRYNHWEARRFGVFAQSVLRFNTYLGLSVVNAIYGAEGLAIAAIVMAIKIPIVNFLSVYALTADRKISVVKIVMGIIRNPLIQACLIGVFLNFTGIGLPAGSAELLRIMGSGSLPLGLLCIGAALQTVHMFGERWVLLKAAAVKLVLIPVTLVLIARLFGWQSQEIAIVVVFFALPAAPTAYILVRQMDGDGTLMAGVIAMQTFFCMFTLPVLVIALL